MNSIAVSITGYYGSDGASHFGLTEYPTIPLQSTPPIPRHGLSIGKRLDTGTFNSLMQAGQFVQVIEERQGLKIRCI